MNIITRGIRRTEVRIYLDKYGLKGGIVRNDERSDELCICTDHYSDDINDAAWAVLENTFD